MPPYKTPTDEVAETTPAFAWSGPFKLVRVRVPVLLNDDVAVPPKKAVFEVWFVEYKFEVVAFARVVLPVTPSVPATWTLPAPSIVVVAVAPKYARYAEN